MTALHRENQFLWSDSKNRARGAPAPGAPLEPQSKPTVTVLRIRLRTSCYGEYDKMKEIFMPTIKA